MYKGHRIYYLTNSNNNPMMWMTNSHFPDKKTEVQEVRWLASLHMAGGNISAQNRLALSPRFFHYPKQLHFSIQKVVVYSEQSHSGGKHVCQEVEFPTAPRLFEIIKRRTVLSTAGRNSISLSHLNMEITITIAGSSLRVSRTYWK